MKLVLVGLLWVWATVVVAQKTDTTRRASQNLLLFPKDTSNANLEDKYILSELEKVQYATYSENLKEETLRKIVENQKLKTVSLEQKLLTERLKAEANRKQAETNRKQEDTRRKQELQNQQIKQLKINQLNQEVALQNRTRNSLFVGVLLLTLLGLSLLRSNRQLKNRNKSIQALSAENLLKEQEKQHILFTQNETLEQQVVARTAELESSLSRLKTTQAQLIQKEKLASLGELTTGIAHEIQNPLNFVNNFSEVSIELIGELKIELEKASSIQDKELENDLLEDLIQNQQKISLHGKRASAIIKGMLEHSRSSSGESTPTDLNKLAEEYLRLSYHGMRAKNKALTVDYELIQAENLPLINVFPQDIGRVLLNLLNNAFYATWQKAEKEAVAIQGQKTVYQPWVRVTTSVAHNSNRQGDGINIQISDNGSGIPDDILPKIFQPFFTTKPTGEGTGLGLSLAYDIITKGHGGTIEIDSKEGIGTSFIIFIPTS